MTCPLAMAEGTCPMPQESWARSFPAGALMASPRFKRVSRCQSLSVDPTGFRRADSHKTLLCVQMLYQDATRARHIRLCRTVKTSLGLTRAASWLLQSGVSATSRALMPQFEARGSITGTLRYLR